MRELQSGDSIGRYVVLTRIGHGGMGVVYSAQDPDLDRRVALKFLLAGDSTGSAGSARLLREAQSLAQLSHPNIVAVHDVGILDDRVWIAMEFLDGPNLAKWIHEKPRPWREILPVFLQAGAGLQAAHTAGFVHRDFKPENVMFGRDGRVRVVDFGLARIERLKTEGKSASAVAMPRADDTRLTMTGALMGTPRYMAQEQWSGAAADAKSDQFSFCVSLWEAIFGEAPFAGTTLPELVVNVQEGRVKTPGSPARAPGWVKAALLRGLKTSPDERWPSMEALLMALQGGPKRRPWILVVAGVVVVTGVVAAFLWQREQSQKTAEIDNHVAAAASRVAEVEKLEHSASVLYQQAFTLFDKFQRGPAEMLLGQYRVVLERVDAGLGSAAQDLETALLREASRDDVRAHLAEVLYRRALVIEQMQEPGRLEAVLTRLELYDASGDALRRWNAPAELRLASEPPGAVVTVERYQADDRGRRVPTLERTVYTQELVPVTVAPGSYRLLFQKPGHETVYYPLNVTRGEPIEVVVAMPRVDAVPPGFVYVPKGRFIYGSRNLEESRDLGSLDLFTEAEPLRLLDSEAFLIARHETTNGEYIAFLAALAPADRVARLGPELATWESGLGLAQLPDGTWQYELKLGEEIQTAQLGDKVRLVDQSRVDWRQLPVAGLTWGDAEAYLSWLAGSGTLPGARLCSEREWERAARGADDRRYPHGDTLAVGEANFGANDGLLLAPTVVGSFPASTSPFGLFDMSGNVFEWVSALDESAGKAVRGGGYLFDRNTVSVVNRALLEPNLRAVKAGLRVCASYPQVVQPNNAPDLSSDEDTTPAPPVPPTPSVVTKPRAKPPKLAPVPELTERTAELRIGAGPGLPPATVWVDGELQSKLTPITIMVTADMHTIKWKYPDGRLTIKEITADKAVQVVHGLLPNINGEAGSNGQSGAELDILEYLEPFDQRRALSRLSKDIEICGASRGAVAHVKLIVDGATGLVLDAIAIEDTPSSLCIAKVVRAKGKFPRFKRKTQEFVYRFSQ